LPAVGVMDMLRFHKFTIGWGWVPEYGSSDNPEQFKNLLQFSPLHNIKDGVSYPATLVTTADHDDRVVPAHSFKYIARLQEKGAPTNPYLIRVAVKAGHGAGKSTAQQIEEATDIWAFVYKNMGINPYATTPE
jgi:prolyl oligopeptidase